MTDPLVVVRPEPGLSATLALARKMGLPAEGAALFAIRPRRWAPPDPSAIDALLIGSANAIVHGGPALADFAEKPVHAVGRKTADAARAAGFRIASVGSGGLQEVLGAVRAPQRLLRVAGAKHVALEPPPGVAVTTVIAYESVPLAMPESLALRLRDGGVVLLHSGEAGRHFARECDRHGIARKCLTLAALAPRIAEAAGTGWRAVHVAPSPEDAELLELVRDICT